jgi:phosphate transport system ATP-binding protein
LHHDAGAQPLVWPFQALKGVTVEIKHGLITSLIGPSGCGKTTLLRCFNRVNERYGNVTTTGEIRILGKNIYDPGRLLIELRKAVGMVFQRPNPLPISVYENVVFGLRIHSPGRSLTRGTLDEAVERALTEVGLWQDLKDRAASEGDRRSNSSSNRSCASPGCCRSNRA